MRPLEVMTNPTGRSGGWTVASSPLATCATSYGQLVRPMPVRVTDTLVGRRPQDRRVRPRLRHLVGRRVRALMGPDQRGQNDHQQQRDTHEQRVDLENAHEANRISREAAMSGCAESRKRGEPKI